MDLLNRFLWNQCIQTVETIHTDVETIHTDLDILHTVIKYYVVHGLDSTEYILKPKHH